MFKIIYNVIIYFSLIYSFYYVVMAIFAFKKTKKYDKNGKINYFAILIAARNEEKVIDELIKSLENQNYDKEKYEINVIINNCTDSTAEIAAKTSAKIIDCDIPVKCKGDVLKYAFKKLKDNKKIDAYVIFDADNVVHPDFLKHMNESINAGFRVAQGTRETKNLNKSWVSSSYAIYFYLQNFLISRSRKNLNLSATINGTGFMVKKDLIDEFGFNTKTLTEDIEFSALCALNKVKIDYVEKAITYDEQPDKFSISWHQRMRWTKGTFECLHLYGVKLIKNFFKTFCLTNIDMLFIYLAPAIQIVSFVVILVDILMQLINIGIVKFLNIYITNNIISLLISYLTIICISTFVVIYNKHKIKDALSGIILFVVFIFTWIPINIVCIFKKKLTWTHIEHNTNLSINDLMQK